MPVNPYVKGGSADVPIIEGGTGASTALGARTNLSALDAAAHALLDHTGLTGVGDLTTLAHASLSHSTVPMSFRNIGTATAAVASGDLAAGDGSNLLFWDSSLGTIVLSGSGTLGLSASGATLALSATGANAITLTTNGAIRARVNGAGLFVVGDDDQSGGIIGLTYANTTEYSTRDTLNYTRMHAHSAVADESPGTIMVRGRGTAASPAAVSSDDMLLRILAQGWTTASAIRSAAEMRMDADGAWTVSSAPGRIRFSTMPSGSVTPLIERMRIDNGGTITVGDASVNPPPINTAFYLPRSGVFEYVRLRNADTDPNGGQAIVFQRSRGTVAVPATTVANDQLGALVGQQFLDGGTGYATAATITFNNDGTPSSSSGPGSIRFLTTPTGAIGATERWRINNAGHFFPGTDNALDIGITATNRIRTLYAGTSVVVGATVTIGAAAITGSGALAVTATGATLALEATGANSVTVATSSTTRLTVSTTQVAITNADLSCPGAGTDSERFGAGALAVGVSATAVGFLAGASATSGVAVGRSAAASGLAGVAVGTFASALAVGAIAIGPSVSVAVGASASSVCIGSGSFINATGGGIVIGDGALTTVEGVVVGISAAVGGARGTAVGSQASAGVDGVAIGRAAGPTGSGVAIGSSATTSSGDGIGVAIGYQATSTSSGGHAFGYQATAGANATAIGGGASATGVASVALGRGATVTLANTCVIGGEIGPIGTVIVGRGDTSTSVPATLVIRPTDVITTADTAGTSLLVRSGGGTGNATVSTISFQTSTATGTGTAQQALATRLTIAETTITATTHLLFSTDNTKDIGASGATRPRTIYVRTSFIAQGAANALTVADGAVTQSAGGLTVTATGAILSLDGTTIETSATAITADAGLAISTTTTGTLSLDSGTTGAINVGTGANAKTVTIGNVTGVTGIVLNTGSGHITISDATNFVLNATTGTKLGTATTQKLGFWNAAPVVQSAVAAFTNNITSGGTNDQIDNYTDLVVYTNDATTIRNNLYQLGRKVDQAVAALRLYGLLG